MRRTGRLIITLAVLGATVGIGPPASAAIINVTTTAHELDDPGPGTGCSLAEAVEAARLDAAFGGCTAGNGPDTISVPAGTYTVSDVLILDTPITIQGAGSAATVLDADSIPHPHSMLQVTGASPVEVSISGLTVQGVDSSQDGAIFNDHTLTMSDVVVRDNEIFTEAGAGVENYGTLTWSGGVLAGNISDNLAGGFYQNNGDATATLENLLITDNHVTEDNDAGAIGLFAGTLTLRNSTVTGNDAEGSGGAIQIDAGTFVAENATITNNTADVDGDAPAEQGGGIYNSGGSVTFTNSILAGNHDAASHPDCGGVLTSGGGNVIGTSEGCIIGGAQASDLIGAPGAPVAAGLAPLANNGGPTMTHALVPGSPAVDRATSCPAADQRGMPRPQGGGCDSGAYELGVCKGLVVSIFGTEGDDVLTGTAGPDGILGFGGNDDISGNGGDDAICAGAGNDRVTGGAGNDMILGEAGKDRLAGQAGKDRLLGQAGKDRLNGGGGKDRLNGGPGKDRCNGGGGKDKARSCEKERNIP